MNEKACLLLRFFSIYLVADDDSMVGLLVIVQK